MEKVFILHNFNCFSCHVRVLLSGHYGRNSMFILNQKPMVAYGFLTTYQLLFLFQMNVVTTKKITKICGLTRHMKAKNSERKENNRIASEPLAFILFGNFQLWQKMFAGCQMLPQAEEIKNRQLFDALGYISNYIPNNSTQHEELYIWFLCDRDLPHEKVKDCSKNCFH